MHIVEINNQYYGPFASHEAAHKFMTFNADHRDDASIHLLYAPTDEQDELEKTVVL
jgi:hypothetical protein